MRRTLGLSYGFHDASAALVVDGVLVAAAAEERFSRQKHDPNFPALSVRWCLEKAGVAASELDAIVYHEDPAATFTRVLASSLAGFPDTRREFVAGLKVWLGKKLWVRNDISKRLDVHPDLVRTLRHHQTHAAQAFLGSPFSEAAVLSVDSVGEWETAAITHATYEGGRPALKPLARAEFPDSLGLVYSTFTAFLGFVPMDGECSTMALAAFGRPVFADEVRKMVRLDPEGLIRVDQDYFNFRNFYADPFTPRFLAALGGKPRSFKDRLPFDCLADGPSEAPADMNFYADVAASIQLVFEELMVGLAKRAHESAGSANLCLAGGGALNCVANASLLKQPWIERLYVPPDPGDGGASVGAALYGDALQGGRTPGKVGYGPYTGAAFDETRDAALLPHAKPGRYRRFAVRGWQPRPGETWTSERPADFGAVIEEAAAAIADGKIVGWCQGAAESGPRALGNRSILIRPDRLETARRLSTQVKLREPYRPYALSIAEEEAGKVLSLTKAVQTPHRWMQLSAPVRPEAQASVRAAMHVDGTTRPQVCSREDNERYHSLLKAVGRRTGLSAVLNTSFNESGYPIVGTPLEALAMYARTAMDLLVYNGLVVRKT
ncbi:MAG: carbamoyl transferase [Elusimicrobia bacterium]|nr:carbamoyl transferase [Elusimicrobiota bacterium]